ncbi:MAG: hypothetical protein DRH32_05810 [Deltaproteobacteria bacterium]|nr:MAG: hypothetical protein DRH32_05810 [Deltaproteobacteria bacterium]
MAHAYSSCAAMGFLFPPGTIKHDRPYNRYRPPDTEVCPRPCKVPPTENGAIGRIGHVKAYMPVTALSNRFLLW